MAGLTPVDHSLVVRRDGTVDAESLAMAVRESEPEFVAASREALMAEAERFRIRRDVAAYVEWLRAARLWEWHMAERWPAKTTTGPRRDDRPALASADAKDDKDAWQRVYAVGRAPREYILDATEVEDLVQRAFRTADAHVGHNTGMPEWYTPAELVEAARKVLGAIDLDPASSATANATVRAERYFDVDVDGLVQEWRGRVWMNPPYSAGLVDKFTSKLVAERAAGNVTAAIVLTNNSTDTAWWQELAEASSAVCFPAGRIRFINPNGDEPGMPLQGQAICYLGTDADGFEAEFNQFGLVLG